MKAAHDLVSSVGWLSLTPPNFRRAVLERCTLQTFDAGEVVFIVGDNTAGIFGIAAGSVRISIAPSERGPNPIHLFQPGTWFGEAPALTGQVRMAGVDAARKSSLLHLPHSAIREIVRQNPAAWRFIALITLGHLQSALSAIDDLMIRDDTRRLVALLLRLAGYRPVIPPDPVSIEIAVSQEELASMANLARSTVNTLLRKLEASGYVHIAYRSVHIREPRKLKMLLAN
jgi:CRP/FNR family transcriptional regulator, cyclic AMP receptor protein